MPLHLLGKKSWNVYNQDNIEKVRRDEAKARAIEDAEEQRMQEIDAERRIQILRGEVPTPLPAIEDKPHNEAHRRDAYEPGRERKRRKKAGENDTEFEMRLASEQTAASSADRQMVLRKPIDAPLVDQAGHIDLFPQEQKKKSVEKNAEAEKEAAKKKKEYEDQYTMRFSNAAGFKQGLDNPWYSKLGAQEIEQDLPGKDVWGNEDPRRKERETQRVVSSDPLAMMRKGASEVRRVERERKRLREERDREMRELEAEEKKRKKRRHADSDSDDLEDFKLDDGRTSPRQEKCREREHRHRHRRTHRDPDKRSRLEEGSRERDRHRHRHAHRHRQ